MRRVHAERTPEKSLPTAQGGWPFRTAPSFYHAPWSRSHSTLDVTGRANQNEPGQRIRKRGEWMNSYFPVLILNARPAAGKSEIIHALSGVPQEERIQRFHIGSMHVLDDFPMLWTWFEEDMLLESVFQHPRLHTTPDGYFLYEDLWHLLIRRLALEYEKWHRDRFAESTAVIEFSRGAASGGYRKAYPHLGTTILKQASALYVQVSYAESLRKNRARYNPDRPDSILEHGLSDAKMERLYRDDDWGDFSSADPQYLLTAGKKVPYVTFENEDDVTTRAGEPLLQRLETACGTLWDRYRALQAV
jgi:hypothetical protein